MARWTVTTMLATISATLGWGPAAGCASEDGPSVVVQADGGVLDGGFSYACVNQDDAFDPCDQQGAFPETIAVGSRFGMRFEPFEDQQTVLGDLRSGADTKLKALGGNRFEVLSSGPVAVLAVLRSAAQGEQAVDVLHVNARPVDRLGIRSQEGEKDLSELRLDTGQPKRLAARPYAAGTSQITAGALEYAWSSSDVDVVSLLTSERARSVTIVARAPGSAVLTVRQGEIERSIDIVVEGM